MQENAVAWDPISINYQLPWFVKIYLLYLLYVVVNSLFRLVSCVRHIRRTNVELARLRLTSLNRTVRIVILSGTFVGVYGILNLLRAAVEFKVSGLAVYATASEAVTPVAIGFFIALVLYVVIAFLESLVEKRTAP